VVVKQAEYVVERRSKLRRHDSALRALLAILTIWQNVNLGDRQTLSRKPDDLMVQL